MRTSSLTLVRPTSRLKESFLEGLAEFQQEQLPWVMQHDIEALRADFDQFVRDQLGKKTLWTQDTPVDETELWAVLDGVYVGRISIRHKLNRDLEIVGGHIGYDTRPAYRGKGLASTMVALALPIAKSLGIDEVLVTCNDSNIASIRVIEKNGGRLRETKPQFEGGPLKRYYLIAT
jgi:predicted acetyltransferase